jgi:hypothetical protein
MMQTSANTTLIHRILQYVVPSVLLCGLVLILWRYFRYYIDPDAISYLNITRNYITGDFTHAVNAFWSPMGCWATALLVKATGMELFAAAITVNTVPALGMVLAGQCLFQQFRTGNWERWCFGIMSSFFWAYTVYFQSFTDIWQFFFLTTGLLLLLKERFTRQPLYWLALGLAGALAYFGKAYSFYFFPLMIVVTVWLKLKHEERFTIGRWLLICGVSLLVMMAVAFPWLYLIHDKYGIWTSSTAGKLNMSWWLAGTQEFREGITVVVPPPYKGSLFYFEDPYLAQGRYVHFWDSPALFLKQAIRVGFNAIGWVTSANRISSFYFVIWLLSILFLFRKGSSIFRSLPMKILVILFLAFPLPYWLLTFDGGRYLWFTIAPACIIALSLMDRFLAPYLKASLQKVFVFLFFASFLITPVSDMKTMLRLGETEYSMAQELKALNIQGPFVSNRSYADDAAAVIRLSWFSGNPWYCHPLNDHSDSELQKDAVRYGVKYYYYLYNNTGEDFQLKGINGAELPEITKGRIPGLKVFQLTP